MVTLTFQYAEREARLTALVADGGPETYDLCADHAERTHPPHGWTLHDDRPADAPGELPDADDLRSPNTVAVLAAALRGVTQASEAPPVDDQPAGDSEPAVPAADDVAAAVDVDALDAIVDQPLDEVEDGDLFASPDEADPRPSSDPETSSDALTELSALSSEPDTSTTPDTPSTPARTVPGARRPD